MNGRKARKIRRKVRDKGTEYDSFTYRTHPETGQVVCIGGRSVYKEMKKEK